MLHNLESLEPRLLLNGALPAFQPIEPYGSLAYQSHVASDFTSAPETDSYQVDLLTDHVLSVRADPADPACDIAVTIKDASDTVLATVDGAGAGGTELLQAFIAPASGAYTIELTNPAGLGDYELTALLNALFEIEPITGATNSSMAESEDLSAAMLDLGNGQWVVSVRGSSSHSDAVLYLEDFESGELGTDWSTEYTLENARSANRVTEHPNDPYTADSYVLEQFGVPESPPETVAGWSVDLTGLQDASLRFENEGDGSVAFSTDGSEPADWTWMDRSQGEDVFDLDQIAEDNGYEMNGNVVLRFTSRWHDIWDNLTITTPQVQGDWYQVTCQSGDRVELMLASDRIADWALELYDTTGAMIAEAYTNGGREAALSKAVAAPGVYYIRVGSDADLDYTLTVAGNVALDRSPINPHQDPHDLTEAGGVLGHAGQIEYRLFNWTEDYLWYELDPVTGQATHEFTAAAPYEARDFAATSANSVIVCQYGNGVYDFYEYDTNTGNLIRIIPNTISDNISSIAFLDNELFVLRYGGELDVYDYPSGTLNRQFDLWDDTTVAISLASVDGRLLLLNNTQTYPEQLVLREVDPQTGALADIALVDRGYSYYQTQMEGIGDTLYVAHHDGIAVNDLDTFEYLYDLPEINRYHPIAAGSSTEYFHYFQVQTNAGDVLTLSSDWLPVGLGDVDLRIELYDPSGALVASDDNSAPDGINVQLSHTAMDAGSYVIALQAVGGEGDYRLNVSGQTGEIPMLNVESAVPGDGSVVYSVPDQVTVTFSEPIDPVTLDADDLMLDATPATGYTVIDPTTVVFDLPGMMGGARTLRMAEGSVTALSGLPLAEYLSQFTVQLNPPHVVDVSVQQHDRVPTGGLEIVVVFDRAIVEANLDSSDIALRGDFVGPVDLDSWTYDPATKTLTVQYENLAEDIYNFTLISADGAFEGLDGGNLDGDTPAWPIGPNASGDGAYGGDFNVEFYVERTTHPVDSKFFPVSPYGSLIHQWQEEGRVETPGGQSSYTLDLNAGQTFTLALSTESSLMASVELADPSGQVIASVAATELGGSLLMQTVPVMDTGTYTLTVEGLSSSQGGFAISAWLNASLDQAAIQSQLPTWRYDFGMIGSPLAVDYTPVTPADTYNVADGYGWIDGTIGAENRFGPDSLRRDMNVTENGTFAVDLPNGTYRVTLTVGDAMLARDQVEVYFEGTLVDTLTTAAGAFTSEQYQVTVADGQLTLRLDDAGGANGLAAINGLAIEQFSLSDLAMDMGGTFIDLGYGARRGAVIAQYGSTLIGRAGFEDGEISAGWSKYCWSSDSAWIDPPPLDPEGGDPENPDGPADLDYPAINGITNRYGAGEGEYAWLMYRDTWTSCNGHPSGDSLNEAVWTVNLTGIDSAFLNFKHADFGDTLDAFVGPFVDHAHADGIAISTDGVNWYPIFTPADQPDGQWYAHSIDLSQVSANWGLTLGGQVKIKFQQFGDKSIYNDGGRGWDDISITTAGAGALATGLYQFQAEAGEMINIGADHRNADDTTQIELLGPAGQVLATAVSAPYDPGDPWAAYRFSEAYDAMLSQIVAPMEGTYYLRVGTDAAEVALVVAVDAMLETERNDQPADAIDLTIGGTVLGSAGYSTINRLFVFEDHGELICEVDPDTGQILRTQSPPFDPYRNPKLGTSYHGLMFMAEEGYSDPHRVYENDVEIDNFRQFDYVTFTISGDDYYLMPAGYSDYDNWLNVYDYPTGELKREVRLTMECDGPLFATPEGLFSIENDYTVVQIDPMSGDCTVMGDLDMYPDVVGATYLNGKLYVTGDLGDVGVWGLAAYDWQTLQFEQVLLENVVTVSFYEDLGGGSGTYDSDYYTIDANAGDVLTFTTVTPNDAPGDAINQLDPAVTLYDPGQAKVAFNDNGAPDGKNVQLAYTVPTTGAYTIKLDSINGAFGEYLLKVTGSTAAPGPFEVIATDPLNGSNLDEVPETITVDFSYDVQEASLDADDLLIGGQPALSYTLIDSNTVQYTLPAQGLGEFDLLIPAGAITDALNRPIEHFSSQIITTARPMLPIGTQAYRHQTAGRFSTSHRRDELTYQLDAGQCVSFLIEPDTSLGATLYFYDPSGQLLGGSSTTSGQDMVLQSFDIDTTGEYRLVIEAIGTTSGQYQLTTLLNAVHGQGQQVGTGDPLANAESLDPYLQDLLGNGQAITVVGQLDSGGFVPFYSEDFESGSVGPEWEKTNCSNITDQIDAARGDYMVSQWNPSAHIGRAKNRATWTVDLSDRDSAVLRFAYAASRDGGEAFSGPFVDWADADGIAICVDGVNWYPIFDAPYSDTGEWTYYTIDLVEAANTAGIVLSDQTQIRFQQYGGLNIGLYPAQDWLGWDDISVGMATALDTYAVSLEAEQALSVVLEQSNDLPVNIRLIDASGQVVAQDEAGTNNYSRGIDGFVAPQTGVYYLQAYGTELAEYALTVLPEAQFTTEPHNTFDDAQNISQTGVVQGVVGYDLGRLFALVRDKARIGDYEYLYTSQLHEIDPQTLESTRTLFPDTGLLDAIASTPTSILATGVEDQCIYEIDPNNGDILRIIPLQQSLLSIRDIAYCKDEIFIAEAGATHVYDYASGQLERVIDDWGDYNLVGTPESVTSMSSDWIYSYDAYGNITSQESVILHAEQSWNVIGCAYLGDRLYTLYCGSNLYDEDRPPEIAIHDASTYERILVQNEPLGMFDLAGDVSYGDDWYKVAVNAGDELTIRTATPADGPNAFINDVDPVVELYAPDGELLAIADNNAPDGRNAELNWTAQQTGDYRIKVYSGGGGGEYELAVTGHTGDATPFAVSSTNPADGTHRISAPTTLTITFNNLISLPSLEMTDLLIDGAATAASVRIIDGRTAAFDLPALTPGEHTFAIPAGAITAIDGQALTAYSGTCDYDTTPPVLISLDVDYGNDTTFGQAILTATFNEPIDPAGIDNDALQLTGLDGDHDPVLIAFDPSGSVLTLVYEGLSEADYAFTMFSGDGQFEDTVGFNLDGEPLGAGPLGTPTGDGTEGGNYTTNFTLSLTSPVALPAFEALEPLGSMVYQSTSAASAQIDPAGDSDTFTLRVEAGQHLTVAIRPDAVLRPTVTLLDPLGAAIATVDADLAGHPAIIQSLPVAVGGEYAVVVSSLDGTTGAYSVQAYLNAVADIDAQYPDGGYEDLNSDLADAQLLDGRFIDLGNGARYIGFVGQSVGVWEKNWCKLTLQAGDVISAFIDMDNDSSSYTHLILYDANGQPLDQQTELNHSYHIRRLEPILINQTGEYYLEISSNYHNVQFCAGVLVNARFTSDMLYPGKSRIASDLTQSGTALTYINPHDDQVFTVHAVAGDVLTFTTETPGDGPEPFDNVLDPAIELYDPSGVLVAENDNGAADGRNAALTYTALETGRYELRVHATGPMPETGLVGQYYGNIELSHYQWQDLEPFDLRLWTPTHTRIDQTLDINPMLLSFNGYDDLGSSYAVHWTGQLYLPVGGVWQSESYADDSRIVWIDGTRFGGYVDYEAGFHDIEILYINKSDFGGLSFEFNSVDYQAGNYDGYWSRLIHAPFYQSVGEIRSQGELLLHVSGPSGQLVAEDDTLTRISEQSAKDIAVLDNDRSLLGQPITIHSFTQGAHGTVSDNGDGTLRYLAGNDYVHSDAFTYTITDGLGNYATARVDVAIKRYNDPPVITDTHVNTETGTSVVIDVTSSIIDLDGDRCLVRSFTGGHPIDTPYDTGHAAVEYLGNYQFLYTPNPGWYGPDSFGFSVYDSYGSYDYGEVFIEVGQNQAPVAHPDTVTVDEDSQILIDVLANDVDPEGAALEVFSIPQYPPNGSVTRINNLQVRYTPDENYFGADSFQYWISDGHGGEAVGQVDITVTPVNDDPVAVDDAYTLDTDVAAILRVLANDSDVENDPLAFDSFTQGTHGTVTDNGDGTLTYTPADPAYYGSDTFNYTAADGQGGLSTATVNITLAQMVNAIHHWTFDSADVQGDTVYDVIGDNHATVVEEYDDNIRLYTNWGKVGDGRLFKHGGLSDYLAIDPVEFEDNAAWSVALWQYQYGYVMAVPIIGNRSVDNEYLVYDETKDTPSGWVGREVSGDQQQVLINPTSYTDTWNHWVWTCDGTNIALYLNGQYQGSGAPTQGDTGWMFDTICMGQSGAYAFDGYIDDVWVFGQELSADEVDNLYRNDSPVLLAAPLSLGVTTATLPVETMTSNPDPVDQLDEPDRLDEAGPPDPSTTLDPVNAQDETSTPVHPVLPMSLSLQQAGPAQTLDSGGMAFIPFGTQGGPALASLNNTADIVSPNGFHDYTFTVADASPVAAMASSDNPDSVLTVELLGYRDAITGSGAGASVSLPATVVPAGSTVTIRVTSSLPAEVSLDAYQNMGLETRDSADGRDANLATVSRLTAGGADAAYLGFSDPIITVDEYAWYLVNGATLQASLESLDGIGYENVVVHLLGPDGVTVLATMKAGPDDRTQVLSEYAVTETGAYTLRVSASGLSGRYLVNMQTTASPLDTISDLVARWTFDEGMGTSAADSGTSGSVADTGTLANGAAFDPSTGFDGALYLDGDDDRAYVDVTDSEDINLQTTTERTISAWVYVEDTSINTHKQVIFEEGGTWRGMNMYVYDGMLYVGGWNTPGSESNWSGTFLSTAINSGQWHHVAVTLNGGTAVQPDAMRGYLDGVEFGSGEGSQIWSRSGDIGIGRIDGQAQGAFHTTKFHDGDAPTSENHALTGWIDEVCVYDRQLTADEVAELAHLKLAAPLNYDITSGLVSHWTFDEGEGTVANDTAAWGSIADNGLLMNDATFDSNAGLGGAIYLNGTHGYVDVLDSADINLQTTTERTISAWVYVEDASINTRKQVIFEEGGTYRGVNIYVYDGRLYVGGWNTPANQSGWSGTFLSTAIRSGQWHHVAVTLNGGATVQPDAMRGYLDGVEFGSGDGSQIWSRSGDIGIGRVDGQVQGSGHTTKFHDGNAPTSENHGLAGYVDDLRVYDRQLSADDLLELANAIPMISVVTDTSNDLVTHWTFDEGTGATAADSAASGAMADAGTLTNGAIFDPAAGLGGALCLYGLGEYVDVLDSTDINMQTTTERTLSAWIFIDDASINTHKQVVIEEGGALRGLNIYIYDGRLYVGGWNTPANQSDWSGTFLSTAISSNRWHHVAVTLNGGTTVQADAMRGYLNGVEFGSGEGSQIWSRSGDIGIGRVDGAADGALHTTVFHDGQATTNDHAFAGWIDDLRVYDRQLSQGDLADLASAIPIAPQVADITSDLVAHWKFNEGAGTTAADSAVSGSIADTGTLTHGAVFDAGAGLDGAVYCDGIDDYVDILDTTDINVHTTTDRTISAWVYVEDASINTRKQVVFEEGGTWRGMCMYVYDGLLYVGGWNTPANQSNWSGTFLSTAITSGQWHHVAVTLNGGTTVQPDAMRGYLDGVEFDSGEGSQIWSRSGDIGIGRVDGQAQGDLHTIKFHDGDAPTNEYHGLAGWIDDVRVYDRQLNEVDLAKLARMIR